MIRSYVIALIFALSSSVANATFDYPGGIVEIVLEKQADELPEVKFGLREPVVIDQGNFWRVLIGIDLKTLPGEYLVYVKRSLEDSRGEHKNISIMHKDYPLRDTEADTDSGSYGAVLHRDRDSMSEISFSNTQQPSLPLQTPLKGQWSDTFGHQVFDARAEKLISQNALSLTTTELANVVAPQNAIISKVDTNQNGLSTLFLDHGRGLYSVIEGCVDVTVEPGNGVVAGAVLCKMPNNKGAGAGERLNTLVWQTQLNGVFVNPLILTQLGP